MRSVNICTLFALGLLAFACGGRRCDPCDQVVKQAYVHKYGLEVNKKDFEKRGAHGKVITTLKDGVTIAKNYVDGRLEGETTYSFKHSKQIEKVSTYHNDSLVKERVYYSNANPKYEIQYDPADPKHYILTQWYESGNRRSREVFVEKKLMEGDYYTMKNQVESAIDNGNGTKINRDEFGKLVSKDNYVDGVLAQSMVFYPTGEPKEIIPYTNGNIAGLRKYYLPDGEPERFEEWNRSSQDGTTVVFRDGEKVAEVPYVNGVRNGLEKRFRDEVFVVEEISWKGDKRHGPTLIYIDDRTEIDYYFKGKMVSKHQFDKLTRPSFSG